MSDLPPGAGTARRRRQRVPLLGGTPRTRGARPSYPALLFAAFAVVFVALGLRPRYPADWLLENVLVFAAIPVLVHGYRTRPFSDGAYTRLFLFAVLHEVGAHYTYSEVPYDEWAKALTGMSLGEALGWERNHYDRLVHFLYGFLLFRPVWELHASLLRRTSAWADVLAFAFMLSLSAAYELVEAGAALLFAGDLGMAYLGTQGDVWDAQKDMAAAALGALLALLWQRGSVISTLLSARARSRSPS